MIHNVRFYTIFLLMLLLTFIIGSTFIHTENTSADTGYSTTNRLYSIFHKDKVRIVLPPYQRNPLSTVYSKRKYKEVIAIAEEDAASPNGSFSTRYLVGMSYFHRREYQNAAFHLSQSAKMNTPIKNWLNYHIGVSYYFMGNYSQSLRLLKELRINSPQFPYLIKAIDLEAKIYLLQKKYKELIRSFSSYPSTNKKVKERLYYFTALAYLALKDRPKAHKALIKVVGVYSMVYSRKAMDRLESISPKYEKTLSHSETVHVAYYFYKRWGKEKGKLNDYRKAINLLRPLPAFKNSYLNYRRLSTLAHSYHKLKRYKEADTAYQRLLSQFPLDSKYHKEGEYLYAQFLRYKHPRKALSLYVNILDTPRHPFLTKACHAIVSMITPGNSDLTVRLMVTAIRQRQYKLVDKVLFDWITRKRHKKVINLFTRVVTGDIDQKYRVKVLYWLGQSALQLGERKLAVRYFKEAFLSYKRNYYAYKSLGELKRLLGDKSKALKKLYQKDKERYEAFLNSPKFRSRLVPVKLNHDFTRIKDPLFHEAFTLLSLGEIREGYKVFLRYLATIQRSRLHHALVISKMFNDMKLFQFSIRYSDFLVGYLNGPKGRNYLSPALRESSYPLHFKNQVFSLARRYGLDPYIILAVIREESRFFAGARSFSGAMGLMQLMPGTARELLPRKKRGLGNFYDARLNIALGTKYFAQLLRDMPLSLAVAGYNGGPNRVKRLYKKARRKVDLINIEHFIELIKIDETRNYVKKVLTSYYNYKEIYE